MLGLKQKVWKEKWMNTEKSYVSVGGNQKKSDLATIHKCHHGKQGSLAWIWQFSLFIVSCKTFIDIFRQ